MVLLFGRPPGKNGRRAVLSTPENLFIVSILSFMMLLFAPISILLNTMPLIRMPLFLNYSTVMSVWFIAPSLFPATISAGRFKSFAISIMNLSLL